MITDIEYPADQPPRVFPVAIDLATYNSDQGEQVVLRLITELGARIDVVMQQKHAGAFGRSLADYCGAPAWR
jgi:hypothetical protein